MKNTLSLMVLGMMFTGSVLAESTSMDEQKMQIDQQNQLSEQAAIEGAMPKSAQQPVLMTEHANKSSHAGDKRDIVGMPLDNPKSSPSASAIGSDHILEMGEADNKTKKMDSAKTQPSQMDNLNTLDEPQVPKDMPMTVDGRME